MSVRLQSHPNKVFFSVYVNVCVLCACMCVTSACVCRAHVCHMCVQACVCQHEHTNKERRNNLKLAQETNFGANHAWKSFLFLTPLFFFFLLSLQTFQLLIHLFVHLIYPLFYFFSFCIICPFIFSTRPFTLIILQQMLSMDDIFRHCFIICRIFSGQLIFHEYAVLSPLFLSLFRAYAKCLLLL